MWTRALAGIACAIFFATAFRGGWNQRTTDFPNYYTAAKAVTEGKPLAEYFDWTWFAEQMSLAGIETRIGAYVPQTPLTMLPLVPLARFAPQTAKRIWISLNFGLLIIALWMLARVTRFRFEQAALIAFCGIGAFYMNFVLGQYYVVVLFLLTAAYYCLRTGRAFTAGAICGVAFGLKLYGGPFLLYFAVRRNWRAVWGMLAAFALVVATAIAIFGWRDVMYYATQVLPRTTEGGAVDPYHPDNATVSALLRRTFLAEPELNPHPLFGAPWLFFFLRPLALLSIVGLTLLGRAKAPATAEPRVFAWFTIAVLLLSTNAGRYTLVVLTLPAALILDEVGPALRPALALLGGFVLLSVPLPFSSLFLKVWLLVFVYIVAGAPYLRALSTRPALATLAGIVLVSAVNAFAEMSAYAREPGRRLELYAPERGQIFSSFPAVTASGVFYQAMSRGRYVLHWRHNDGSNEELRFDGNALRPHVALPNGPLQFELAKPGAVNPMQFDLNTRSAWRVTEIAPPADSATSPDGRWFAFTSRASGSRRLYVRNVATHEVLPLGEGNCNSSLPAWELDSKALIFASDCGRAYGTSALWRAELPR